MFCIFIHLFALFLSGFEEPENTIILSSWVFWAILHQWWSETHVSYSNNSWCFQPWNWFHLNPLMLFLFVWTIYSVCSVVETLKDYAIKALVNTVDHLGSVTYKVNDLLDAKVDEVSCTELRVSCIEQVCWILLWICQIILR